MGNVRIQRLKKVEKKKGLWGGKENRTGWTRLKGWKSEPNPSYHLTNIKTLRTREHTLKVGSVCKLTQPRP